MASIMLNLLRNPVIGGLLFLLFAAVLYWLGGRMQAQGTESPGKHLPYACGEDLSPDESRLSYQRFFRLALVFVVVHMATLVVVLLPSGLDARALATIYLVGVVICVDILTRREE